MQALRTLLRNRIVQLLVGCAVLVVALYWIGTHSFVTIQVEQGTEATYSLSKQPELSRKTQGTIASKRTVRKLVRRGDYQVLVQKNELSYFTVVYAKGFLGSAHVNAKLASGAGVTTVGDNALDCMNMSEGVLFSNGCTSRKTIAVHVPAGKSTPTYVLTKHTTDTTESIDEGVEDVIGIDDKVVALGTMQASDDEPAYHRIYLLRGSTPGAATIAKTLLEDGTPAIHGNLPKLDAATTYKMLALGNGFIVYGSSLESYFYYSSLGALQNPVQKSLKSIDSTLVFSRVEANDSKLVATYIARDTKLNKTELVVDDGKSAAHYSFTQSYVRGMVCGSSRLCLLNAAGTVDIYDTASQRPDKKGSISGVKDMLFADGKTYLVLDAGLLDISTTSGEGHLAVSFDGYRYKSIARTQQGVVLNAYYGSTGYTFAFLLSDSGDKTLASKLAALSSTAYVKSLSVYKNSIFVIPALGELKYNTATELYEYDKNVRAAAREAITAAIAKIGFDTTAYQITVSIPE